MGGNEHNNNDDIELEINELNNPVINPEDIIVTEVPSDEAPVDPEVVKLNDQIKAKAEAMKSTLGSGMKATIKSAKIGAKATVSGGRNAVGTVAGSTLIIPGAVLQVVGDGINVAGTALVISGAKVAKSICSSDKLSDSIGSLADAINNFSLKKK